MIFFFSKNLMTTFASEAAITPQMKLKPQATELNNLMPVQSLNFAKKNMIKNERAKQTNTTATWMDILSTESESLISFSTSNLETSLSLISSL